MQVRILSSAPSVHYRTVCYHAMMLKHLDRLKVLALIVGVVTAMVVYKYDFDRRHPPKKDGPTEDRWD